MYGSPPRVRGARREIAGTPRWAADHPACSRAPRALLTQGDALLPYTPPDGGCCAARTARRRPSSIQAGIASGRPRPPGTAPRPDVPPSRPTLPQTCPPRRRPPRRAGRLVRPRARELRHRGGLLVRGRACATAPGSALRPRVQRRAGGQVPDAYRSCIRVSQQVGACCLLLHRYSLAARIASASASRRRSSSAVTLADRSGSARTWRMSSRITSAAATSRTCAYPRRNP